MRVHTTIRKLRKKRYEIQMQGILDCKLELNAPDCRLESRPPLRLGPHTEG